MKRFLVLAFALFLTLPFRGQQVELKTNLLYLTTTTPNIGVEWSLSRHYTASLMAAYNPFRFFSYENGEGSAVNPKLHHWLTEGDVKYWFCESFLGWNVGVNMFGGEYNVGGIKFISKLKDTRYKGWAAGAGVTIGYQFPLSPRWGLDMSVGVGYVHARYGKYDCYACGDKNGNYKKNYLGPTKAAVSLVYAIK